MAELTDAATQAAQDVAQKVGGKGNKSSDESDKSDNSAVAKTSGTSVIVPGLTDLQPDKISGMLPKFDESKYSCAGVLIGGSAKGFGKILAMGSLISLPTCYGIHVLVDDRANRRVSKADKKASEAATALDRAQSRLTDIERGNAAVRKNSLNTSSLSP